MTSEQAQLVKEQAVRLTCVADAELVEIQKDDFAVRIELLDGSHELTSTVVVDAYAKIQRIKATHLGDTLRFAVLGQNGKAVPCDRETWRNWQNAGGPKQTMKVIQNFGDAKGAVWFCGVSDTLDGLYIVVCRLTFRTFDMPLGSCIYEAHYGWFPFQKSGWI